MGRGKAQDNTMKTQKKWSMSILLFLTSLTALTGYIML